MLDACRIDIRHFKIMLTEKHQQYYHNIRKLLSSPAWAVALTAVAALIHFFDFPVAGVIGFILLMCAILVFCDDLFMTFLPFILLSNFVITCHDSFDTFIKFIWIIPIVAFAVIFHFVAYKKKPKIGKSFFGSAAVAVAITLGGVGSISFGEYFNLASLYYVGALGVGMLLTHFVMKSCFIEREEYNIRDRLALYMYLSGMLCCFIAVCIYKDLLPEILTDFRIRPVQYKNNLSTFLMFAMPFPFYFARKNYLHILSAFLMLGALFITYSRGGVIFGTIEFFICLVAYCFVYKKNKYLHIGVTMTIFLVIFFMRDFLIDSIGLHSLEEFIEKITHDQETRPTLFLRAIEDFKNNIIFGQGIGYTGNSDIYDPVKFAMNWYHMMIPQIIGSLGLLGILAYSYQFGNRIRIVYRNFNIYSLTLFLSYVGVLMMSQVNPGYFCPIPYELLAVMFFTFIEPAELDERDRARLARVFRRSKKSKDKSAICTN